MPTPQHAFAAPEPARRRSFVSLAVVFAGGLAGAVALYSWSTSSSRHGLDAANYAAAAARGPLPAAVYRCASCHAIPTPDLLPRERWPRMLDHMHSLIVQYELGEVITPEDRSAIATYYAAESTQHETLLAEDYTPSPLHFARTRFGTPGASRGNDQPFVGALTTGRFDENGDACVVVSDTKGNQVTIARRTQDCWVETSAAHAPSPARVEVADLDGDGRMDLAIAALGGVVPSDAPMGKVVLAFGQPDGSFRTQTVLEGVSRVADVRAVDLDGDSDLDLLVALFGLYKTGGLGWLERLDDGHYEFHRIHEKTGYSHVVPFDADGDGRVDFVALAAQEHEEVLLFRNTGDGEFEPRVLFKGPHPMYGLCGLVAVDLDRDGDLDLLLTNGDALDIDPVPKPWHGVQWLENRGNGTFVAHDIWRFYGAYSTSAADLDGDGDLDLVVTSMLNHWQQPRRTSIAWLENDGAMNFTPHAIDNAPTSLVCTLVHDVDGDGRPDILGGGMHVMPPYHRVGRVTCWKNLGPR
jgi:hypothetical protein